MGFFKVQKIGFILLITFVLTLFSIAIAIAREQDRKEDVIPKEKAHAKYEIEEITVSAQKREENIQEVPISISVLSEVQIDDAGIRKTEDFIHHIPNSFMIKKGAHADGCLSMRGISGLPGDASANPSVGFYVDGVYYSGGSVQNL